MMKVLLPFIALFLPFFFCHSVHSQSDDQEKKQVESADYADFSRDLLALVQEENIRGQRRHWLWQGESRDKKKGTVAGSGVPAPSFSSSKPRQFGVTAFEPARKRRSEGRFPAGIFPSSGFVEGVEIPAAALHSGRIFPSPRIFQRFKPREVAPGQIRVEASSVAGEFPEWLALHAGRRGPIRAKSYRELLLHALNRAQSELSRRHRLHWAGPSEKQRPTPKQRQVHGAESPSSSKKPEKADLELCRACFGHWRPLRATRGMSDWEVSERCCPGRTRPRTAASNSSRPGQSKAKANREKQNGGDKKNSGDKGRAAKSAEEGNGNKSANKVVAGG